MFFSADWARLTLVAESFLLCLQVSQQGGGVELPNTELMYIINSFFNR